MEMKQLQYFVVSVDMGSLSRAANVLYTTQPHISKTIKSLENELDMTLLSRNASGVVMTEEGKRVYEYARNVLKCADKILQIKKEKENQTFSLSMTPSNALARLFAEFYLRYQRTQVRMKCMEGTVEQVLRQVQHQDSEIGFLSIADRQKYAFETILERKKLDFIPLKKIGMALYVGEQNPLYRIQRVTSGMLRKLRYVQTQEEVFSLGHSLGHLKEDLTVSEELERVVITNSEHVMIQLLMTTNLCNISCDILTDRFIDHPIRAIPLEEAGKGITFGYVKRKEVLPGQLTEEFIIYVKEALGQES
ncbi:MAG: LysR family transcriptional regulator [Lachnospiraceae bacterium]|jgi:DNA-binding transcriptional LysR family regulator